MILKLGPASFLFSFLTKTEIYRFNLLCRATYHRILPGLSPVVSCALPKKTKDFLNWEQKTEECIVKRGLDVSINNQSGTYYGEWSKFGQEMLPHGCGIQICGKQYRLGYLEKGNWLGNTSMIEIDLIKREFGVYFLFQARPDGKIFQVGAKYCRNGQTFDGIFYRGALLEQAEVNHGCSGFLGMGQCSRPNGGLKCMYSSNDTGSQKYFGEHNQRQERHGKGVFIQTNGHVRRSTSKMVRSILAGLFAFIVMGCSRSERRRSTILI